MGIVETTRNIVEFYKDMDSYRGMVVQNGRIWGYSEIRPHSPFYILARTLETRRLGVAVYPFTPWSNECNIYVTPEGEVQINRVSRTAELRALLDASSVNVYIPERIEPDVSNCDWDELTKIKTRSYYWQSVAREHKYWADYEAKSHDFPRKDRHLAKAKEAEDQARQILGTLSQLSVADMRSLIGQVIDRELALPKS